MIAQSLNISVWSLFTILVDDFIKKKLTLYRALWLLNKKTTEFHPAKIWLSWPTGSNIFANHCQGRCDLESGVRSENKSAPWTEKESTDESLHFEIKIKNNADRMFYQTVYSSRISSPRFHCDWCILERYLASNLAFQTNACGARFARQWKLVPLAQQPTVSQIHTCAAIFCQEGRLYESTTHPTQQLGAPGLLFIYHDEIENVGATVWDDRWY